VVIAFVGSRRKWANDEDSIKDPSGAHILYVHERDRAYFATLLLLVTSRFKTKANREVTHENTLLQRPIVESH